MSKTKEQKKKLKIAKKKARADKKQLRIDTNSYLNEGRAKVIKKMYGAIITVIVLAIILSFLTYFGYIGK